jgi:hypothetical protein
MCGTAALVDAQGRFRIEVASGGQYGLHLYSSGYLYHPEAIKVETGKTLEVSLTLVPSRPAPMTPSSKGRFFPGSSGRPSNLCENGRDRSERRSGTPGAGPRRGHGARFALDPPRWVWSLKSNYPNGVYQLEVNTAQAPINPQDWHFVVADHQCNTSDILSYPHEAKPQQVIK